MATKLKFTPHSTVRPILGGLPTWWPPEEQERIASYEKYDQLYWNDPTQYELRVLDGEYPIYVPNARTIVDTTAHYLLKGLRITQGGRDSDEGESPLNDFLKRERFLSMFQLAKLSGVARGDWVFHMTADPDEEELQRISLEALHPGQVIKIEDPDRPGKIIRVHIIDQIVERVGDEDKVRIRKLTYHKGVPYESDPIVRRSDKKIWREEAVWEFEPYWWSTEPKPKKVRDLLELSPLPDAIDAIPVFWFSNMEWQSWWYGSSDLKGLESLQQAVSQISTDTQAGISLTGLGVYATDGGRPVDNAGREMDWEVVPGGVVEVPQGSFFRRVEGLSSITPALDQIKYLEQKMAETNGLSDVALGRVDVAVAQSGIALAIRFMPTLAKIEHREQAAIDILNQLWYNWQTWMEVYEGVARGKDIEVEIAPSKLPRDPKEELNELNNMLDRGVISKKYYRKRMEELGHTFPTNIEDEINQEREEDAKYKAMAAPQPLQQNAQDAAAGKIPPPPGKAADPATQPLKNPNNQRKPNESKGTEA